MNDKLLPVARMFDPGVSSVQFIVQYRNIICSAQSDNHTFILRLTDQKVRSREQIESELHFQHYLFMNGADVAEPLPTVLGNYVATLEMDGMQYCVSAFSVAPGKDWDDRVDENPRTFQAIGKALGRIHRLSKDYQPAAFSRRFWYEQQELLPAETLFKQHSYELHHAYIRFIDELKALPVTRDTFGLTHGDYLMSNYLIDGDKVTVIDFDECEYSWFAADLAICLRCYIVSDEPEKVSEKRSIAENIHYHFLLGYQSENSIPQDMIDGLNKFIRLRDYIEIAKLLATKAQGRELCDIEERLLAADLDRVLNDKPFLQFDLHRVSTLSSTGS